MKEEEKMEVLISLQDQERKRRRADMDPQRLILRLKRETDPFHLLSHGFHIRIHLISSLQQLNERRQLDIAVDNSVTFLGC